MTDNTAHMVFKGEPAVKLHAKNIEVVEPQTRPSHYGEGSQSSIF